MGPGARQHAAVQQRGTGGEAPLGTAHPQLLPLEEVGQLAREAVDGVALGHGCGPAQFAVKGRAVTADSLPAMSPVRSYSPSWAMRRTWRSSPENGSARKVRASPSASSNSC